MPTTEPAVSVHDSLLQQILAHQYEASLSTLHLAIASCPAVRWHQPVVNLLFCQAAFHVTFFADVYLQPSDDPQALKAQPFHVEHQGEFRDYEEMKDRAQVLTYEQLFVQRYLLFVREKARRTLASESAHILAGPSGFRRRSCSRAELHIYNIRHIQHHAAQLSLRLRQTDGIDIPWVSHAWRETLLSA